MHPINPAGLAAFDLETTGVDPTTARIVSASVVRLHGGQPAQRADWLADPGIEIPDSAAAIHGITTAHARAHGRPHDVVVAEIVDALRQSWALGYTVVVYNAAYDLRILATQYPGFTIDGPVFDPLVVDRAKVRYRPGKRTLEKVAAAYGVVLSGAHDAYADAQAAGQIAHAMLTGELGYLAASDPVALMHDQREWSYDFQTNMRSWLQSKGRDTSTFTIDEWPIDDAPSSPAFQRTG